MVDQIKFSPRIKLAVLEQAYQNARKNIKDIVGDKVLPAELEKITSIDVDESLPPDFVQPDDKDMSRLKVGVGIGRQIASKLLPENSHDAEQLSIEKSDRYLGFNKYENKVQDLIKNVSKILERAFGRSTGMLSWVLRWFVLAPMGFTKDNYEEVKNTLEHDPEFIKKYSEYLLKKEEKIFNEQEKRLVKIIQFTTKTMDKLNKGFVEWFPMVFSIQDMLTPIFARIFNEKPLGKFFDFLRIINPWISEFASEPCAVFNKEIDKHKDEFSTLGNDTNDLVLNNETKSVQEKLSDADLVSSIELVNFSKEEYELHKIVKNVSAAVERLFGKKNNVVSWILNGIVWYRDRNSNFKDFVNKKYANNSEFIKKLCKYFKEVKDSNQDELALLKERFIGNEEQIVARATSGLITISNTVPEWLMDKGAKYFGIVYSFQNLFLPLFMKMFVSEKGFFGKMLGIFRDITPILNNFVVDPVATFQEEIRGVKEHSKSIKGLLPEPPKLPKLVIVDKIIDYVKSFYSAVSDFFKRSQAAPSSNQG